MSALQTTLFAPERPHAPPGLPLQACARSPLIALDVEADHPDPRRARLTHVAWATPEGSGAVFAPDAATLAQLREVTAGATLVCHNAPYDLIVLARAGCDLLDRPVDDTRAMSVLLDEHGHHTLSSLAHRHLHARDVLPLPRLLARTDPACLPDALACKARVDCERTLQLRAALGDLLHHLAPLHRAYTTLERHLPRLLARCTLVGVPVDRAALQRAARQAIEARAPQQAARLARWAASAATDGRVHPLYSAWSDPCGSILMQGARADGGPSLLSFLAPPDGRVLLAVTFPHLALRWLATLAACEPLLEAFRTGTDPGEATERRSRDGQLSAAVATAWLEALARGRGPRAVMRVCGLRLSKARTTRQALERALPSLPRWMVSMSTVASVRGWLQAPSGRRRRFAPRYTARRAAADLVAICCADTVKHVLVTLGALRPGSLVGVHRETVFVESAPDEVEALRRLCEEAVSGAAHLWSAPLAVRVRPVEEAGRSWAGRRSDP